jgi:coenzyme F420-reducing hydrogenase delta subunit
MNTFVLGRSEESRRKRVYRCEQGIPLPQKVEAAFFRTSRFVRIRCNGHSRTTTGVFQAVTAGNGVAGGGSSVGRCQYDAGSGGPLREGRAQALMSSEPGPL